MLAIVPSITTAMRVKKILKQKGIEAEVMQTPRSISNTGCSYCIKFDEKYLSEVYEAIERVKSSVKSLQTDEGEPI